MNKIVLIGGGGHCRSCIDVIEKEGQFEIAGIIDTPENVGGKVLNYEITGTDADLPTLVKKHKNFLITLGQLSSSGARARLFDSILKLGGNFPVIISPHSYISKYSKIGMGTIVMHGAIINAGAEIGNNCILNTACLIEHDVVIGNNCHISTSSVLNGGVNIGDGVFFGSGAIANQYINICPEVVIGAGSVIIKNITEKGTYAGIPGGKIKSK